MSLFTPNGQLLPLAKFREALAQGADPNAAWQSGTQERPRLPLLEAAQRHTHHLRQLLANPRTDVGVVDRDHANALTVALKYNHIQAVFLLILAGVSVHHPDCTGSTPLHYAVHAEGVGPVRQLLSAGASPNARGPYGRTPMGELLMEKTTDQTAVELKCRAMLSAGADPNLADDNGRTALHAAAVAGYDWVVEALLEFGADPERTSRAGMTALEEARSVWVLNAHHIPYQRIAALLNRKALARHVLSPIHRVGGDDLRRAL